MPDAAQYTLGLFDSTALGWTVETPPPALEIPADARSIVGTPGENNVAVEPTSSAGGVNYALAGDRQLARGWPARARDNLQAIQLSRALADSGRAATHDEQEQLIRFIGFGATELAQNCFPVSGASGYRGGWDEIGQSLVEATTPAEYAALQRACQYAHYTPEPIIRALWRAAEHLGFDGGRVLEPGMGTGLFFALMCVFRRKAASDSDRMRPLIPTQGGH